jgi:ABC-type nitrate/sulfonate/bicarbonate transport system permease component
MHNDVQALRASAPIGRMPWLRGWYSRHEGLVLSHATALVVIGFWEFCWKMKWISPLLFSGPSAIHHKMIELVSNGQLLSDLAYSGGNYLVGLALALLVGVPLGVVLGWYHRLQLAFDPLISALHAAPRVAVYPLIIIWFGIGSGSKVFIVFITAVLPIVVNTIAGIRNIDADSLRAARVNGATDRQFFTTLVLPCAAPFILTGVRQAVAHGLIGEVIAEITAGNQGIGYMIAHAGKMFAIDTLMVGVVVTALSGVVLTNLAERLQRHVQRRRIDPNGAR